MPNGNLKDYLRQNRSNQTPTYDNVTDGSDRFTPRDLLSYAWQTARGMEHLAKHNVSCRDAKGLLPVGLHWRAPFIEDLLETVQMVC